MKKIISLLMVFCMIPLVSASLNEALIDFEIEKDCQIIDYGKVDSQVLVDKFNLTSSKRACNFLVDYEPFEENTKTLAYMNSLENYSGMISSSFRESSGSFERYFFILGESEGMTNELMNMTVNYENETNLFSEDILIFKENMSIEESEPMSCSPDTTIDIYSPSSVGGFNSSCVDNNTLSYPYCENGGVVISYFECSCSEGACVEVTIQNIINTIKKWQNDEVTTKYLLNMLKQWLG